MYRLPVTTLPETFSPKYVSSSFSGFEVSEILHPQNITNHLRELRLNLSFRHIGGFSIAEVLEVGVKHALGRSRIASEADVTLFARAADDLKSIRDQPISRSRQIVVVGRLTDGKHRRRCRGIASNLAFTTLLSAPTSAQ